LLFLTVFAAFGAFAAFTLAIFILVCISCCITGFYLACFFLEVFFRLKATQGRLINALFSPQKYRAGAHYREICLLFHVEVNN